ncbi:hypothetical protein ACFVFF_23075 [Streptomyces sp. NPDC057680]|uniref:hypothetical protein n=1 Tax=Streptomyces sp. NPDC057680 TaxID=3346208 RepID=UPI003691D672
MSWRDRQERKWRGGLRADAAQRILTHLASWRDRQTFEALYDLPAHQPARKETGQ